MLKSSIENKVSIPSLSRTFGVVGAGGAGFPAYKKLDCTCELVIANGVECEPLLHNDKYLLQYHAGSVIAGLRIVMETVMAQRGIVALKSGHPEISAAVQREIDGLIAAGELEPAVIELLLIDSFYPAGDEQILVYEATGKMVPEGGLPLSVGCLVHNVETLFNIKMAAEGRPVISRYLTCTGAVKRPSVVQAHIGTAVSEIIGACGGALCSDPVVILGGPMMGKVELDLQIPVTKTLSGVIVLPRDHELIRRKTLPLETIVKQAKAVCCQCTWCSELCSRNLIGHNLYPHLIMRQISYGLDTPPEIIEGAMLCSECGLCEVYSCVMGLSPSIVNRVLKEKLKEAGHSPHFPLGDGIPAGAGLREYRKIPTGRVINRLHLHEYDRDPHPVLVCTSPERVEILLKQHIGKAAVPCVTVGTKVGEGDIIGTFLDGDLSVPVHSSIQGTVQYIDEERIVVASNI
jgi:Na+-translocating ferredoxin:NAD+ oxidoreductase RnfC subunit